MGAGALALTLRPGSFWREKMKSDFYLTRKRILEELGAAETELETMEGEALTKCHRLHLAKSLEKVRKALCATLVLGMEQRV
jgi:hypothetical protein